MKLNMLNTFSVHYEVLRGRTAIGEIYAADDSAEVRFMGSSELAMSFRGTFFMPPAGVDFLTDRLRPVVVLNGREYPCGIYCITTETETTEDGCELKGLQGYSVLYLAKRTKIEERITIKAGENYITRIVSLLASCGIEDIDAEATDYTIAADRSDWEIGTSVLTIVNTLLKEINFRPAWVDLGGRVRLRAYRTPTAADVVRVYADDEYSVLEAGYTRTEDRFGHANVFRVECDSPDLDKPMAAISVNDSAASPYAVSKIGRILHVERVDGTPSQDALQEHANRLRNESLYTTEDAEIAVAPIPECNAYDVISILHGRLSGFYTVMSWRLPLSAGASMTQEIRRVYA